MPGPGIEPAKCQSPSPVIVEAWRGGARSARIARLLEACIVEPLFETWHEPRVKPSERWVVRGVVDGGVMASAARRGDRVLTSDFEDLDRLRARTLPACR